MKIERGFGTTVSERKLAEIADRTFLDLWSYPNTFIDKKQNDKGDGKEFCDLLVICGNDVIIFSDKSVEWPKIDDINLAWSRWFRRAVEKSVSQIQGAAAWIQKFPQRVFLDKDCLKQLPISFPDKSRMTVHGIAVAVGANEACKQFLDDNVGTFMICSSLKGSAHVEKNSENYTPFAFGDINPGGPFIHVFDEISLDVLFYELDTITDFVEYLTKRARLIRNEYILFAAGEEDLLAHYLRYLTPDGSHDFVLPPDKIADGGIILSIGDGAYEDWLSDPLYQAKKNADRFSYVWDDLISKFSKHILAGTSVSVLDEPPMLALAEPGLRIMALETRFHRRLLGQVFLDALQRSKQLGQDRYFRTFFASKRPQDAEIAYVFLVMAYPKFLDGLGGYREYRRVRAVTLQAYCLSIRCKYKNIKQIVGIALDASPEATGRQGGSEDMIAIGDIDWTDELIETVLSARQELEIMQNEEVQLFEASINEYPLPGHERFDVARMSRQQRRAAQRKIIKQRRRGR